MYTDKYFFHPDHLGSSNYITNLAGTVSQHIEYLPFGELLVDEHLNSHNSPFKFNAKELDPETGNYYYGARYYDPKWSIWLSVDPLAEKYSNISPYAYVANNPIRYIDPDGKRIVDSNGNEVKVSTSTDKNGKRQASYSFAEGTKKSVIRKFNRNGGRIINSMVNSDKGLEMVNKAVESKDNIHFNISDLTKSDRLGETSVKSSNYAVENGEVTLVNKDIEVTVFLGSISNALDENNTAVNALGESYQELWKDLNFNDIIGGVGGHEIHHALNDMDKNYRVNPEEHKPAIEVEKQIYQELRDAKNE